MTDQDQFAKYRLLLMSNSTNYGESFLAYSEAAIRSFLGGTVRTIVFLPFAGVTISYDDYAEKVRQRLGAMGYAIIALHEVTDKVAAIQSAEAVMVGGGNTFHLLDELYRHDLLKPIRQAVSRGTPYLGWSAGSNLACPTIMTTNDMPIVQPPSLEALGLIPFQLNPHYSDAKPEGHGGESRDDRILEYLQINQDRTVVGLYEGSILRIEGHDITIIGDKPVKIFKYGQEVREVLAGEELRNI